MMLVKAIQEGDTQHVSMMLYTTPLLVEKRFGDHNETPLHKAARYNKISILELLLEEEAKLDVVDKDRCTVLHYAAYYGHLTMCKEILTISPDLLRKVTNKGNTALDLAACRGHQQIVKMLQGREITSIMNKNELTAVFEGGDTDSNKITKQLLLPKELIELVKAEKRCDPQLSNGKDHLISLLFRKDAKGDFEDKVGRITSDGYVDILKVLWHHPAGIINKGEKYEMTDLLFAAIDGHVNIVKMLLRQGIKADVVDNYGWSALHCAANYGHISVMKEILRYCPEIIDEKDVYNKTALHLAAKNGHLQAVEFLLKRDALVTTRDKDGTLPIHLASIHGHTAIVALLLKYLPGDNEIFLDTLEKKLLTFAIERKNWDEMKILLRFFAPASPISRDMNSTCKSPAENEDASNKVIKKKLSLFLTCLFAKYKDVSARWVGSILEQQFVKNGEIHMERVTEFSEDAPLNYLSPFKRRAALNEMKESIGNLQNLSEDVIDWRSDVIPLAFEIIEKIESSVPKDEVIYLLENSGYLVNENNHSLLQTNDVATVTISVQSKTTKLEHKALVYFNTCNPEIRMLFDEKKKHLQIFGFKDAIEDRHSIIILNSLDNLVSLAKKLSNDSKRFRQEEILSVLKQIMLGVSTLHNRNIAHCAIKPSNIFIDDSNSNYTRLGDLLSVIEIPSDLSQVYLDNIQRTFPMEIYTAPEMNNTESRRICKTSADIWSIGCVLYELITWTQYHVGENLSLKRELIKQQKEYSIDFVDGMFDLLEKMLINDSLRERITADQILNNSLLKLVVVPDSHVELLSPVNNDIIGRVIGSGGFGSVLQNGKYAIKQPHSGAKRDLEHEKEVSTSFAAGQSANVVKTFPGKLQYSNLVMEFCEKGSLDKLITSKEKPFTFFKIASYCNQMTRAVEYLQDRNIVHRDIKPANFVVNNQDVVKLIDFGLSRELLPGQKCQERVGTLLYMAPELERGDKYDNSVDIYSLGCVFYDLITSRRGNGVRRERKFEEFAPDQQSKTICQLTCSMVKEKPRCRPRIGMVRVKVYRGFIEETYVLINELVKTGGDIFLTDEWKDLLEVAEGFLTSLLSYIANERSELALDSNKTAWLKEFLKLSPHIMKLVDLLKNFNVNQLLEMYSILVEIEKGAKILTESYRSSFPESDDSFEYIFVSAIGELLNLLKKSFTGRQQVPESIELPLD